MNNLELSLNISYAQAKDKLRIIINKALQCSYGTNPDKLIEKRIEEEWMAIDRQGAFVDVISLYEFTKWLKGNSVPYYMMHTAGASLIFYLLGITFGNPLPPHSYCPKCNKVYWKPLYLDGFDIPNDFCDSFEGTPEIIDMPDLIANVKCTEDNTRLIHDGHNIPWQSLWGYENSFLQFTIRLPVGVYNKVYEYLSTHCQLADGNSVFDDNVKELIVSKISFIFDLNVNNKVNNFYNHTFTYDDADYVINNWKSFISDINSDIPEPGNIADMFSIYGMLSSNGILDETTRFMIDKLLYPPSDLISFREDIYQYLISHGFSEQNAWQGMEQVRKGKGLLYVNGEMLNSHDQWVLRRCENIRYLCSKAHIVEEFIATLKLHKCQV